MAKRRKSNRPKSRNRTTSHSEWIGGRLTAPFFIEDGPEPYRPELVVWMEEPSGLVVGHKVVSSEDAEGALGRELLAAMGGSGAGPACRPDTIRVADAAFAAEVRAAVGNTIPVTVAPTPEFDALLEAMLESMPGIDADASYLDGGRIAPAVVAKLFVAAELLYQIAPWKVATDDQVLRLDIPGLGVEGACLSIIGSLGESLGLLIFPSDVGYEAFIQAVEQHTQSELGGRLDLGTDWLALHFERGADLPASMRREVASHGWPVANAKAYPVVKRYESDGMPGPATERDFEIASACATSLCAFFTNHRSLFEAEEVDPVSESLFDENELEVRFTVPYAAYPFFEVDDGPARPVAPPPRRAGIKPGRNAPCPCGSGRKYKKCCLARDEQAQTAGRECEAAHDLDGRLAGELSEFAMQHFGSRWRRFMKDFGDASEALQLSVPWSVYHYKVDGVSALEAYLEQRGRSLSRTERLWLDAQQLAWLSVWEVTEVEPGESITLRDLLSDETRCVREVSASQTLVARDVLLGRVVDHQGVSLLCGAHPRPLPPVPAAEVVRRARGRLRRKRTVPVERLRDEAFGRYLIRRWEEAVEELDIASAALPQLHNTDGDPLLFTTDHFQIAPGARERVEAQIAALPDVEPPEAGDDPSAYVFLRPGNARHASWENTVIGRAQLSDTALQLETNSQERADALRALVEAACGDDISYRVREHADPLSSKAEHAERDVDAEAPLPSAEAAQLVLEFKQRHYADWPDQPLPALDGKTPRAAVKTAQGRAAVDVLLKDMENHEQRAADGAVFDFSTIRRELHLES